MGRPSSQDIMQLAPHLKEDSYAWVDGLASYHQLLNEKHCKWKELVGYKSYDPVNHLNNVNSFHNKIENAYQKYRGVATKYINRYASLFVLQREYAGMDRIEKLLVYANLKLINF